jgi:hypothetical protein
MAAMVQPDLVAQEEGSVGEIQLLVVVRLKLKVGRELRAHQQRLPHQTGTEVAEVELQDGQEMLVEDLAETPSLDKVEASAQMPLADLEVQHLATLH